jgi:hypothetical protein
MEIRKSEQDSSHNGNGKTAVAGDDEHMPPRTLVLLAASAPVFEFQAERENAAGVGDVSVIEQTGQPWLGKVNQGHSFERLLYGLRQKSASSPVIPVPCLPRCPAKP